MENCLDFQHIDDEKEQSNDNIDMYKKYWRCKTFVGEYKKQQLHNKLTEIISEISNDEKLIQTTVEKLKSIVRRYGDV